MVLSVSPDPTGNWLLSGSKDMTVYLWDISTGVAEMRLGAHGNSGTYSFYQRVLLPVY